MEYEIEIINYNYKWFFKTCYHRKYGPSVGCRNGTEYWYYYGQLHREDGPAIICPNGNDQWWANGSCFLKRKKTNWIKHGL